MQRSLLFYFLQFTSTLDNTGVSEGASFPPRDPQIRRSNSPFGDGFSTIHHKAEYFSFGIDKSRRKKPNVLLVLLRRCRRKKAGFLGAPTPRTTGSNEKPHRRPWRSPMGRRWRRERTVLLRGLVSRSTVASQQSRLSSQPMR